MQRVWTASLRQAVGLCDWWISVGGLLRFFPTILGNSPAAGSKSYLLRLSRVSEMLIEFNSREMKS